MPPVSSVAQVLTMERPRQPEPAPKAGELREFGSYAGLGLQFAMTMAVLGGLGWWLDGKLSTTPWLLVAGVLIGAIGGFIRIVRAVPPARGGGGQP
jgi:F0F1-type ATP synthase assembly protein I